MTKYQSKEPIKGYMLKLPAEIHKKLVAIAIKERRSLGEQIIYMLERSLEKSA
jgi:predicted HicB family RNase H-like nuclease